MQEQNVKNEYRTNARGRRQYYPHERQELLKEFKKSGLTLAAFALEKGINHKTFGNWRRKQRQNSKSPVKPPSDFLEFKLPVNSIQQSLNIRYKNFLEIQVSQEVQVPWVCTLIKGMEEGSC